MSDRENPNDKIDIELQGTALADPKFYRKVEIGLGLFLIVVSIIIIALTGPLSALHIYLAGVILASLISFIPNRPKPVLQVNKYLSLAFGFTGAILIPGTSIVMWAFLVGLVLLHISGFFMRKILKKISVSTSET